MSQADIQTGNVCRNEKGQVGVIENINFPCGQALCQPHYYGSTLAGGYWQSMEPVVLAESLHEYEEGA